MDNLKQYWQVIKFIPGYQSLLKIMGYSEEDLDKMSNWDIEELEIEKELSKLYITVELQKVQKDIFEFKSEMKNEETDGMRLDYLKGEKKRIEFYLNGVYKHNREMKQRFFNPLESFEWLRMAIMDIYKKDNYEKELKRINFEIRILENKGSKIQEGVDEYMIARAKEFPFSKLTEVNRAGFTKCPFHEDKTPSMYVKNNFYHCFSCGVTGDTIDYIIKTKNISFVEAVKLLQ